MSLKNNKINLSNKSLNHKAINQINSMSNKMTKSIYWPKKSERQSMS